MRVLAQYGHPWPKPVPIPEAESGWPLSARSNSPAPEDQRGDEQDDEDDEQDLGDPGSGARDAEEAEESRYQRDDQKDNGVVQHGNPPCPRSAARTASLHPAGTCSLSSARQGGVTRVDAG